MHKDFEWKVKWAFKHGVNDLRGVPTNINHVKLVMLEVYYYDSGKGTTTSEGTSEDGNGK